MSFINSSYMRFIDGQFRVRAIHKCNESNKFLISIWCFHLIDFLITNEEDMKEMKIISCYKMVSSTWPIWEQVSRPIIYETVHAWMLLKMIWSYVLISFLLTVSSLNLFSYARGCCENQSNLQDLHNLSSHSNNALIGNNKKKW